MVLQKKVNKSSAIKITSCVNSIEWRPVPHTPNIEQANSAA
jgi:hypothetical protein